MESRESTLVDMYLAYLRVRYEYIQYQQVGRILDGSDPTKIRELKCGLRPRVG